jgi:hypothetical protein
MSPKGLHSPVRIARAPGLDKFCRMFSVEQFYDPQFTPYLTNVGLGHWQEQARKFLIHPAIVTILCVRYGRFQQLATGPGVVRSAAVRSAVVELTTFTFFFAAYALGVSCLLLDREWDLCFAVQHFTF